MQSVICKKCKKDFIVESDDLSFYKKMLIPVPRKCWNCRYVDRINRRGPYKFWKRACAKCKKEISANYAPDGPEIVYCESCYQKEVY